MHAARNEGNFASQQLCFSAKIVFVSCLAFHTARAALLYGVKKKKKHTHTLSLAVLLVIASLLCVRFRQFYALDFPQGINLEKSNQTVFISTDSHFSFISSDGDQILF